MVQTERGSSKNLQDMLDEIKETASLNGIKCDDNMIKIIEMSFYDLILNQFQIFKNAIKNCDLCEKEIDKLVERLKQKKG